MQVEFTLLSDDPRQWKVKASNGDISVTYVGKCGQSKAICRTIVMAMLERSLEGVGK